MSSRKRPYQENDDDESTVPSQPPHHDIKKRIGTLLIRIGDKSSSTLESNIQKLAFALDCDLKDYSSYILDSIFDCILHLPYKIPIYACLISLINEQKSDFGLSTINEINRLISNALTEEKYFDLRLLLRFLAELVNVKMVSPSNFLVFLNHLMNIVETQSTYQLADNLIYGVLCCLPYCGAELSLQNSNELGNLFENIETFFLKRHKKPDLLNVWTFESHETEDLILNLWYSIKTLKDKENWKQDAMIQPYSNLPKPKSDANHTHSFLFNYTTDNSKVINNSKRQVFILPPILHIFDSKTKSLTLIEKHIVRENIFDLLTIYRENHKVCTRQINSLPFSFSYRHLIIESLFSELFTLPFSRFPSIFIGTLIVDLFKAEPSKIPPYLGQAISIIFSRIEHMEVQCLDRFSIWFSFHLSNFNYLWPWKNWLSVLDLPDYHTKKIFIRQVLDRCVRLSYWQRIKETVPEEFLVIMPQEPQPCHLDLTDSNDDTSNKYGLPLENMEDTVEPEHDITEKKRMAKVHTVSELIANFTNKTSSEYLLDWFRKECALLSSEECIDILFIGFLQFGDMSFSHLFTLLERYREVIVNLNLDKNTKEAIINTVTEFWRNSSLHIVVILIKLQEYRILDPMSIVNWLFSDQKIITFQQPFFWELLSSSLDKSINKSERIDLEQNELEKVQQEKKDVFIVLFQRFCITLTKLLKQKNEDDYNGEKKVHSNKNYKNFTLVLNRMIQYGRFYYSTLISYWNILELIFTSDVDITITRVFQNLSNLKEFQN